MTDNSEKYSYEIKGWIRTLDYLQQENIHMKNQIADILSLNAAPNVLDRIEQYNNLFLNKDTVIAFLRRDIKKLQENNISPEEFHKKRVTLRYDMEKMEKEFGNLKYNFTNYIHEVL